MARMTAVTRRHRRARPPACGEAGMPSGHLQQPAPRSRPEGRAPAGPLRTKTNGRGGSCRTKAKGRVWRPGPVNQARLVKPRGLLALDTVERWARRTDRRDGEVARGGGVGGEARPIGQRRGDVVGAEQDELSAGAAAVTERGAENVADGCRGRRGGVDNLDATIGDTHEVDIANIACLNGGAAYRQGGGVGGGDSADHGDGPKGNVVSEECDRARWGPGCR